MAQKRRRKHRGTQAGTVEARGRTSRPTTPRKAAPKTGRERREERLALGSREIYVHYPSGQGRSKLRLAGKAPGTGRNMNTVARLAELARELK